MPNYIREYYEEITKGRIVVSKKIRQQLDKVMHFLDHPEDNHITKFNLDGSTYEEFFIFDEKAASRPISFIETFCRHIKGEFFGKPVILELWEKAIIQSLYGFVSVVDGYRRFRHLHLYVARKNGKTLLAACLIVYEMLVGGEAGAECYTAATKREQAKIAWDMAKAVIQKNPSLFGKFRITVNGIYTKPYSDNFFKPVSKESKKLDGVNAHIVHIDELHAITDSNILKVLWDSTKSRKQPIEIITTTMGTVRVSTFDTTYEYDENFLEGIYQDDRLLVFCYELDEEKEWKDFTCWIKANPNLGVSQSISDLREEVQKAINDPSNIADLLCKSFNVRQTDRKSWLTFEELNNTEVYDLGKFDDSIVIGGFDLSRTGDLTAFTTLLFDKKARKVIAETMYWVTKKYLDKATKVPLRQWVRQGFVRVSGDEKINYHDIVDYVWEQFEKHNWKYVAINYDSYSAEYLIEELAQKGYSRKYILNPVIQGFKTLSIPMQELGSDLKEKKLSYQNNPVTKWCLSNVDLVTDRNGNYMPDKSNYERKIDGVSTIIDGYVAYCQNKEYYMTEE
jgi:phage terminase large subunit-like protein